MAAFALPAAAAAQEPASGGAPAPAPVPLPTVAGTGGTTVSAPDGSVTLTAPAGPIAGRAATLSGKASEPGAPVQVEQQDGTGAWKPVAAAVADASGAFSVSWRPTSAGSSALRAVLGTGQGAQASRVTEPLPLLVLRAVKATWYGPGFIGKRTACRKRLGRTTLGVAHRTLPCGTPVAVSYRGRALTLPVVDRGPYARGVEIDLTQAAARALGVRATVRVGFLPVPPSR